MKSFGHPILANKLFVYYYVLFWLIMSVILACVEAPLVHLPKDVLITNAFLASALYGLFVFLLYYIIKYALFSVHYMPQRIINYLVILLLFVVCTVGLNLFFLYQYLPTDEFSMIKASIPARILLSLLFFSLSVVSYLFYEKKDLEQNLMDEVGNDLSDKDAETVNKNSEPTQQSEILERITVKLGQKIQVIPIEEIIYFQAERDYVMIFSINGKSLKEQTMKSLEEQLPAKKFVRVHRSNIVNIDYISRIELYEKQTYALVLSNGHQIKMSENGYKLLKTVLNL